MHSGKDLLRQFKFSGICLLLTWVLCACQPLVLDHPAHEGHDAKGGHDRMTSDMPGMDMSSTAPDPSAWMHTPEKLAADKRESEFNHHLAGFFVVLAGIFILAEPRLSVCWPKVGYAGRCVFFSRAFLCSFSAIRSCGLSVRSRGSMGSRTIWRSANINHSRSSCWPSASLNSCALGVV